ncbi:unnamed protein product [Clonostachys rhizophaga]|uniref:NB-ARC domain-containing protein n=1 Tax=Clonostachys rhizophaga TaxID=160324 RepID=A0A9N9VZV3_9HYPO|nr:unnamed protein product [Clonostachys rhizophaga]
MAELNPLDYTVAWIAPLEIEAQVALHLLDKRHQGRFPLRRGDDYIFQAGEVCGHNVVVATLPAGQEYGVGSAAALASQVKAFFPNLWFGLLVGVAAGLPNLKRTPAIDIRLGDVLVALGDGDSAGLVAYDLGKETSEGMKLLQGGHVLAATEPVIRSAIGSIKMNAPNDAEILKPYYESIKDREHTRGTFEDPGQQRDNLYEFDEYGMRPVSRWPRPESKRTRVWYGPIGSGDKLLKDARKRNELRDKYNIIGLEMEAAGTMNRIPVGVIRGVCDYGDAFKNKYWQPYAAAMAGAYAKAVLAEIRPRHAQDAEAAAKQLDEMKLTTAAAAETIVLLPFGRDPCFVGRESELKQLGDMLETDADAHSFVEGAIVGLGGIGKTQIANEFAHRLREKDSGRPIIWLHASSQARLEHDFNVLARQLNPRTEYGSQTEIFTMVKEWLEAEASGRWLLIIDNADEEDVFFQPIKSKPQPPAVLTLHAPRTTPVSRLSEFLPTKANCAVLYTSRHMICVQKLLQRTRSTKIMEIPTLSVDDSVRMLRLELYGSQEDPDQTELSTETTSEDDASVKSLVELLGCLPLAITQAASFMRENGLAPNEYAALYSDAEMDHAEFLEEEFIDWRRDSDTPNAVLMTWKLSFEQIKSKNKVAVQVLSVFSALDSHGVPDWMLPYLPGIARFQIIKAIAILRSFSFISRRGNSMHRLVQVATRAWIGPEMWQAAVQDALRFLCNVFAGLNSNEWVGDSELKYSTLRKSLDYYPHTKSVLRALSTVTPLESISGSKDQSGSIAKSTMDSFLAEWDTGHLRSDEFAQKASEIYQEIITGGYQSLNDMIFFRRFLPVLLPLVPWTV